MKTVSLLSAILVLPSASLLAKGQSEIEVLRSRIDVQERRITQLENTLKRLQGNAVIQKTPAQGSVDKKKTPVKAVAVLGSDTALTKEYVVEKGDTLTRIARKSNTTVAAIKKENNLKSDSLRVGQKLRIPEIVKKSAVAQKEISKTKSQPVAQKTTEVKPSLSGKHIVKAGETFYGIARQYKMSEAALQAANPKVTPTRLQIGQVLVIDASAKSKTDPKKAVTQSSTKKETTKTSPKPTKKVEKKSVTRSPEEKKSPVAQTSEKKESVASTPSKESSPVDQSEESSSSFNYRTATVEKQMTFAEFAELHGASTSKLNALNGLRLTKNQMLAKGSELYVPQD